MSTNSLHPYQIVRLSEERIADLKFLYEKTFGLKASTTYLKKKYDTGFAGSKFVGYLAYAQNGEPAAYYGVFPLLIRYRNSNLLAAQSGDTMTHPSHQGKGLFTQLAQTTYDLAKKEGIKFIFGFPNKNSYHGFVKKLGWTHRENMKTFVFKATAFPLIKIAKKLHLNTIYLSYTSLILRKYISKKTSFPNSTIDAEHGGVLHDELFFKYKTYTSSFLVEIEGVSMWIKLDGKLWVGDIEHTTLEKFKTVLDNLKKLCFRLGCSEISFTVSPQSYWSKILSKEYTSTEGLPIGYLDLNSGLNIPDIQFNGADFDTF